MLLLSLFACASGPVSDGLAWTVKTTEESTRISYRMLEGGAEAAASIGVVGTGTSCLGAMESAGEYTEISTTETISKYKILGSTEVYHPLVPNSDKFSSSMASVVQMRVTGGSSSEITTKTYDPNSTQGTVINVVYADSAIESDAEFFGLSADEYLVSFPLGNIWLDPEVQTVGNVNLLTRVEPENGDIWSSTNGNTVYIAQAKEATSFGGMVKKAYRVNSYEVGNLQSDGSDVVTQCLHVGRNQFQSGDPSIESADISQIFLDTTCQGNFEHVKTGSEWWYKNVKVKEKSTVSNIEITDYGYEWYETNDAGTSCTRMTSMTFDVPEAVLFVEYDLITTSRNSTASGWTE